MNVACPKCRHPILFLPFPWLEIVLHVDLCVGNRGDQFNYQCLCGFRTDVLPATDTAAPFVGFCKSSIDLMRDHMLDCPKMKTVVEETGDHLPDASR